MSKINHSKFKNTGIIFELLVRQIASDTVSGNDSPAVNIIKKYFSNTELAKEYKLYQAVINSKNLSEAKSETLLNSVLESSKKLSKTLLRRDKYNLIKEIKESYNIEDFFKAKISNYKEHAALYTLIETYSIKSFVDPTQTVESKITLLEFIGKKPEENTQSEILQEFIQLDKGTRIVIYKSLVNKFNKKYSNLIPEQKQILSEYINNISNNTIKLKDFVNEMSLKVRGELKGMIRRIDDKSTQIKLNEVIELIQPLGKNDTVKDESILNLLQYYELADELKNVK